MRAALAIRICVPRTVCFHTTTERDDCLGSKWIGQPIR